MKIRCPFCGAKTNIPDKGMPGSSQLNCGGCRKFFSVREGVAKANGVLLSSKERKQLDPEREILKCPICEAEVGFLNSGLDLLSEVVCGGRCGRLLEIRIKDDMATIAVAATKKKNDFVEIDGRKIVPQREQTADANLASPENSINLQPNISEKFAAQFTKRDKEFVAQNTWAANGLWVSVGVTALCISLGLPVVALCGAIGAFVFGALLVNELSEMHRRERKEFILLKEANQALGDVYKTAKDYVYNVDDNEDARLRVDLIGAISKFEKAKD